MSYILDALKKSERERPPGPVPDLFTVHGPRLPSPRRSVRAIVAVTLLLVVLAIGLVAWMGTGRRDEGAARPPVDASPQPYAAAPAVSVPPHAIATPTEPAPARVVARATVRRPVDERSPTTAKPAQKSPGTAASAAVPLAASDLMAPVAAPVAPGATPLDLPAVPGMPLAGIQAAADLTAPEPAVSVPAQEPPADGRVLDLDELPAPIRAELPKLLVTGHVWSEDSSLRLLNVNDRLLHEGGELAPGVSLQEITQSGAVFVFKGWRFRVAGGRP